MSDTQDEPFDKEAEKEKLRQQLDAEEEDRQATQHMSELLLKGATMTNKHCDQCGDPLFRHEGREFCPSCGRQRAVDGREGTDAADTEDEASAGAADVDRNAAGAGGQPSTGADQSPTGSPGTASAPPRPPQSADQSRRSQPQYAGDADLPAARDALARKVTALAHEAEATTDVGRARELLAAVREGAEALRALEGRGR